MHNQPSQSVATPNISPAAAALLATAAIAGTILAGLIAAQAVTDVRVYVGAAGLLATIASVAGVGFIVQLASERVMQRLDQIGAKADARRGPRTLALPGRARMSLVTDAESVPPVGIDSETIGAARKIARGLIQEG